MIRTAVFALAIAAAPAAAVAAEPGPPLLGGLFQNHAVFQRDRPIALWGRARPGEAVTLRFAGRTHSIRADRSGAWRAELPALPAGGPYQLIASSASGLRQTMDDILIGDVWLCSGQSNMEWPVSQSLNAWGETAAANDGGVRILTVGHDTALTPLDSFQTPVRWQAVTSSSIADFSAACWFMGREIRATQKVPVGLIDASWGGTAIDAWRSEGSIERTGLSAEGLSILRAYRTDPFEGSRRWGALWERWWRGRSGDSEGSEPWRDAAASTGEWTAVPRMTAWETWGEPSLASFNGMLWYRTSVTLTPEQAAQPATISLGYIDEVDQSWVNGVPVGSAYGPGSNRAYDIPKGVLRAGENHVVVNVLDSWGAGGMAGPEELRLIRFADGSSVPLTAGWRYRVADKAVGSPPRAPWETNAGLSLIHNGMIAPLGGYGVKGVAWYQGESDAGEGRTYQAKLAGLMADWRAQFGQPRLPFLVVQLAGWGPANSAPKESGSADIRDAQRRAVAADPNAGLAVAIDIGDRADIHPANKQDVGRRLARAARRVAYGEAVSSGPVPVSATRAGGSVTVTFHGGEGGIVAYSAARPFGFELCGTAAGSCRFVDARLEGDRVVLDSVGGPADRVRYCWGDSPMCNLYDSAGLPATPFELAVR